MATAPKPNPAFLAIAAIALIAAVSVIGSAYIYYQYEDVQKQSAQLQTRVFRGVLAVERDLERLELAIEALPEVGPVHSKDLGDLSTAVDFLFVRAQALDKANESSGSARLELDALKSSLQAIIGLADWAMAENVPEPREFGQLVRIEIDRLSAALLDVVDQQYFRQSSAITSQVETLVRLTLTSIGLLWIFALIASGCVLLYIRALQAQSRRRVAEEKAHFLAYFDPMTGLPNRARFRDAAEEVFEKAPDSAILIFDLDDFKLVNDLHGHAAGDAVLMRVADCIKATVEPQGGTPARLGGDEFAAILPGPISSMRAAALCEQMIAEAGEPMDVEGAQLTPMLSIGIAFARSIDDLPETPDDRLSATLKAADTALYRAKADGKCTYAFFDVELAEMVQRRRDIETGITEALANGDFQLAFQPQVDLQAGGIKGFEGLARWIRDGEFISPGEFISVAEATGQVVEIDLWGLRHATQVAADWIREGLQPVTMSANLSPLHFRSTRIVDEVADALKASGLPPHLLTLEITESVLIDDVTQVTNVLERLRQLGVKIALDDFGTGYSSLAYLRKLDVDIIKIDQSFVRDLERGSETQILIDALVDIAVGLRKRLVVEGIETEEQSKIITELGCDFGQGYLFGKPLWHDEAKAMVPRCQPDEVTG